MKTVFHFIKKYQRVILKPEVGSFAQGVLFIEKHTNGDYSVIEGANEQSYNEVTLTHFLRERVKKGNHVVQQYIETRTKDGQPFDIRVHMLKNGEGEWEFALIYPRIGIHRGVVTGGYISRLQRFLKRNSPQKESDILKSEIESASLNVASIFESFYDHSISELALDIALNEEAKLYLIEVNVNKPGTKFHEFEVAKLAIPYAISLIETAKEKDDLLLV